MSRWRTGSSFDNVVGEEGAARVFEALEEVGLVAGRERIEQRVEELAQERLRVLKQEHGIPV